MAVPPRDLVPGKLRVLRRIGGGGMGVVYEALHLGLDCRVAVKVIHPHCADSLEMRTRFLREARALALLQSEHIVRVLDVDTLPEGAPYMVMEYLEGRDLKRELRKRGALPVGEAVGYLLQACAGISAAHRAGIVHRDIKPANVFISNLDGARQVKMLDFGVAKFMAATDQSLTAAADLVGTTAYMAPEQIRGEEADSRSDVWALGVVLHEILTGRSPFRGVTNQHTLNAVLDSPPPPLHEERDDVPLPLARVVTHCLEKDRLERFADASELASALAPFAPIETTVRWSLRVPRGSSLPPRVQESRPHSPAPLVSGPRAVESSPDCVTASAVFVPVRRSSLPLSDPLLGLAMPPADSLATVTASIPDPGSVLRSVQPTPAPTTPSRSRPPKTSRWKQLVVPVGSAITLAVVAAIYTVFVVPTIGAPTLSRPRLTVVAAASHGSAPLPLAATATAATTATEFAPAQAPPAQSARSLGAAPARAPQGRAVTNPSARPTPSSAIAESRFSTAPVEPARPPASAEIPLHL